MFNPDPVDGVIDFLSKLERWFISGLGLFATTAVVLSAVQGIVVDWWRARHTVKSIHARAADGLDDDKEPIEEQQHLEKRGTSGTGVVRHKTRDALPKE